MTINLKQIIVFNTNIEYNSTENIYSNFLKFTRIDIS